MQRSPTSSLSFCIFLNDCVSLIRFVALHRVFLAVICSLVAVEQPQGCGEVAVTGAQVAAQGAFARLWDCRWV